MVESTPPISPESPWERRASRAVALGLAIYCTAIVAMRMEPLLAPYVAETDWKQWIWQYHRYSTPGAFPPGQFLTELGFVMSPPGWWALMAGLTTLSSPVPAAIVITGIAFVGALLAVGWAVAQRTHLVLGAAAAALLARDETFYSIICGGYPRSFGPALTLAFLGAWLTGRHRLVLGVLVGAAALYPSVVVPCGLAYGLWSVVAMGREQWLRRNLELAAAGLIIGVLALSQNLLAPDWWGSVVTLAEGRDMPALHREGRTPWIPFHPFWPKVWSYVEQPFGLFGKSAAQTFPWASATIAQALAVAGVALCALGLGAPWLARLRGQARAAAMPLHPLLLIGTAIVSYFLARELAFKLYLPHRMVQHVVPYATIAAFVLAVGAVSRALVGGRAWPWVALAVSLSPFALAGDGVRSPGLRSYAKDAPLYQFIEKNTPVTAQFAGNLQPLDEIPLFAARQVFVNWKMAHPFRKGYYAEVERRMLAMYDAYYANDLADVLAFCEREKIDYFVVDTSRFTKVERGDGQLFEPIRSRVDTLFKARKGKPFVLRSAPREAVVFKHRVYELIDVAKLRAWAAANPGVAPAPAGPPVEGDVATTPSEPVDQ